MEPRRKKLVKGLSKRVQRELEEEVQSLKESSHSKPSNVASKSGKKRKSSNKEIVTEEQSIDKRARKLSKRNEQTHKTETSKRNKSDTSKSDGEEMKAHKKSSRFGRIRHRSSIALVIEVAQQMNEAQREAVSRIGLGNLLELPFTEIPSKLCLWIVQNYDARKCHIVMDDGSKLEVTEDDVEICLGLPRGDKEIVRTSLDTNKDLVNEWRAHIGKESRGLQTRPLELLQAMFFMKDDNGEEEDEDAVNARKERYRDMRWFLRDFVILIYSCLLEPHQCGPVNQNLIMPLDVIDDLGSYNWCGFVIDCLIRAKEKWAKAKNPTLAYFTGPLIFLTVHYLDRVVNYKKRDFEPRSIPAFIGWTDILIKNREKLEMSCGGFGAGTIEPQQSIKAKESIGGPELHVSGYREEPQFVEQGQPSAVHHTEDFNKSLGEDFKDLLKIVIKISEKTTNLPDKTNKVSLTIAEAVKSVLGATTGALTQVDAPTQFQKALDTFEKMWTDDELDQVMKDFENARNKREALMETDFPDLFGLITSEFPPTPVGGNVSPIPPSVVGRSENTQGNLQSDDAGDDAGDDDVIQDDGTYMPSASNPSESIKPHEDEVAGGLQEKATPLADEGMDVMDEVVEKDATDKIDHIVQGIAQDVLDGNGAAKKAYPMISKDNDEGTDMPQVDAEVVVPKKARTKKVSQVYTRQKVRRSERIKK